MKITKREKVMLIVLSAIISIFVYYDFLLNPRLKQIESLREEKYLLEGEMSKIEHNRNEEKLNKVNVEGLSKEMKLLAIDFFHYIEEEDVINVIDEIINNSGINISSMSITSEDIDSGVMGRSIPRFSVTLSYSDALTELMKFISEIENYHKEIVIKYLSISGGELCDMTGSVTLELYYFPIGDDKKIIYYYPGLKRKNPFNKQ
ncbi:hypothetical protein [Oceanirhabdus seepicola]|uniref:Type 4a pilus biogenesis protein PilO n=1 Tax=Oceanirhabdus seepicola TaxID=2828781 RepID=A0A9J6P226_9CLOT|nr:hypothetical protein [Oceanirhabdus seepicola]MCM1990571.1 hypothetical protein [Oceanirhabdus seepicola]